MEDQALFQSIGAKVIITFPTCTVFFAFLSIIHKAKKRENLDYVKSSKILDYLS